MKRPDNRFRRDLRRRTFAHYLALAIAAAEDFKNSVGRMRESLNPIIAWTADFRKVAAAGPVEEEK